MPRFAANLSFLFSEVPFLERFTEAAHAGFRAVEFAFPYTYQAKELATRIQAQRLEVVLFNTPPGDWDAGDRGLASLPGREHEFSASVSTALRFAHALKCSRLHVMAGVLPQDAGADERARRVRLLVRNMTAACEEAALQNVTLLIEPINPRDMPNYLISTQSEAHAIREEVGMPNLRVQMDLYHAQIVEGDLSAKIRRWLPSHRPFPDRRRAGSPRAGSGRNQLRVDVQAAGRTEIRRLDRLRVSACPRHDRGPGLDVQADRSPSAGRRRLTGNPLLTAPLP